jgi:hypothetical protein
MVSEQNPRQRVMPTLRMTNYEGSKDFYVARLGFQIDWEHRFEPGFPRLHASVARRAGVFSD